MGGECAPSHTKFQKLAKTLMLKTNDCLIECYVHEIEEHY